MNCPGRRIWHRDGRAVWRAVAVVAALTLAGEAAGSSPEPHTAPRLAPSQPPHAIDVTREYPSEAWSPYPSQAWSPSSAEFYTAGRRLAETESELLPEPPVATSASDFNPSITIAPSVPWCAETRPQSHYLPSLCRFGLVAPHTPGVESSHSPYLTGPAPWGPPTCDSALFGPPPAGGGTALGTESPSMIAPEHPLEHAPCFDSRAEHAPYSSDDFTGDPLFDELPYDVRSEQGIYGDKYLNPTQRPWIEWGMPLYDTGPVPPPSLDCGPTNPALPRFYLYGDYRAALARNDQNGIDKGVLANRLNLEWDLWLTATERFHMFTGPFQDGNDFMRLEFDEDDAEFFDELDLFDANTDTLFFEGDLGYMMGGWTGQYAAFDMPVAVGLIPLLFQNGYWMEDAIVGAAVTIPARNSPAMDWSNFDVTFFTGFDQVTSPAFANSNSAAHVAGATTFIEAKGGYFEIGYAFLDDTAAQDRSYHNVGLSYTRRYLNFVSNSVRAIGNAGQSGPVDQRTADGVLFVVENSFLTPWPYHVIPYVNLFAGLDTPQSVARAGAAGGILRNVGILFESDFLTGYPTLDATANETCGGAVGIDLLAPEFKHQLIVEAATVQTYGNPQFRSAPGDQYGVGARYQYPISNATLLRFDAMYGWLDDADNISGVRAEYRWKF